MSKYIVSFLVLICCSLTSCARPINEFEQLKDSEILGIYLYEFPKIKGRSSIRNHNYKRYEIECFESITDIASLTEFSEYIQAGVRTDWNHWSSWNDESKYKLLIVCRNDVFSFYAQRVTFKGGAFWMTSDSGNKGYILPKFNLDRWLGDEEKKGKVKIANP